MPRVLVFIPTYNENDNVERMCREIASLSLDADLLFMDDNSPDGTGRTLDLLAQKIPRMTVVHRAAKLGIGGAHLDGLEYAYDHGYEKLVTMDCDFTHSPSDIPMMLARSDAADVTIASRYLEHDSLPGWSLWRKALTTAGHVVTTNVLGIANDATGAFRVYDLRALPREVFEMVTARGYAFFFQSLFILHQNGYRLADVPIRLPARTQGHSKMSHLEIARSVSQLVRLYLASKANPERFRMQGNPATRG